MSLVISSVLCGGHLESMPSRTFCMKLVSSIVVKWGGLYLCGVSEKGICVVVFYWGRFYITLGCAQSRVIGFYEAAFVGVLFGFNSAMIFLSFYICGSFDLP